MRDKQGMMLGKVSQHELWVWDPLGAGAATRHVNSGYIWGEAVFGRVWVSEGPAMCRRERDQGPSPFRLYLLSLS